MVVRSSSEVNPARSQCRWSIEMSSRNWSVKVSPHGERADTVDEPQGSPAGRVVERRAGREDHQWARRRRPARERAAVSAPQAPLCGRRGGRTDPWVARPAVAASNGPRAARPRGGVAARALRRIERLPRDREAAGGRGPATTTSATPLSARQSLSRCRSRRPPPCSADRGSPRRIRTRPAPAAVRAAIYWCHPARAPRAA
jgi:hypothetical protein